MTLVPPPRPSPRLPGAEEVLARLVQVGIDLDAVSAALEVEGIGSFTRAFAAPSASWLPRPQPWSDTRGPGPTPLPASSACVIGGDPDADLGASGLLQVRLPSTRSRRPASRFSSAATYSSHPRRVSSATSLSRLQLEPWDITRLNEPAVVQLGMASWPHERDLRLAALSQHPVLIQRPILILDDGTAVIGRTEQELQAAVDAQLPAD